MTNEHPMDILREVAQERHHYERLARLIDHAHSLGTRKENQIRSLTFSDEDKQRVVKALERAARMR